MKISFQKMARLFALAILLTLSCASISAPAFATPALPTPAPVSPPATPPATPPTTPPATEPDRAIAPSLICTNFVQRMNASTGTGDGLLTTIFDFIEGIVGDTSEKMYKAMVNNKGYQDALNATVVLFVALFGVFFTIGMVQASFGQVLMRLIKLGIVYAALSPSGGWDFFNTYVVTFFNEGTEYLVKTMIAIGTGTPVPAGGGPFYQLDKIAGFLIHPETIVLFIGSATSGPFSMGMTGLLLLAFMGFFKMLIDALRTYAVSFVVRSILLAVGPIFIVFLLFDRTKQLFMNWVNLLIATSLQPIMLFTFLAFMLVMIDSAAKNMLNAELCWGTKQATEGENTQSAQWVFRDRASGRLYSPDWTWQGNMNCTPKRENAPGYSAVNNDPANSCPEFPIKIIDILTFLLLVWLCTQFSNTIEKMSSELAGTYLALDPAGRLQNFLESGGKTGGADANPSQGGGTPPATPPAANQPTTPRGT